MLSSLEDWVEVANAVKVVEWYMGQYVVTEYFEYNYHNNTDERFVFCSLHENTLGKGGGGGGMQVESC